MILDAQALLNLLPAIYRTRDTQSGGALTSLLDAFAEQLALFDADLAQLYDDQFIETCSDWVVPYIGDLVGYRQLHGVAPAIASPRSEVADTLALRRQKGTAAALERLAADVTGWDALVVEQFQRMAIAENLNNLETPRSAFANLRRPLPFELLNGPFDRLARVAELRSPSRRGDGANIANVTLFLWRLRPNLVSAAPATPLDATRFQFNPLGAPMALFSAAAAKDATTQHGDQTNVSQALGRLALAANLAAFYGSDKSFFIDGVAADAVSICNLSDMGAAWAHAPPPGKVAIDPQLGRIAFGTAPAAPPKVTFHHGAAGVVGGGSYFRGASFAADTHIEAVPAQHAAVQDALTAVAGGGVAQIGDCGRYAETLTLNVTAPGRQVELRAAEGLRPLLSLGGELKISGAAGSAVSLNGLLIAGAPVHVPAAGSSGLASLALRHCTLVPGLSLTAAGDPAQPPSPSLIVEAGVSLQIDGCILGGLRVAPGAEVTIVNSIIDATSPSGVAYAGLDGVSPGGALTIADSTVIGKVHASALLQASNVIFLARLGAGDAWAAPMLVDRRQAGGARFSYLPPGARAPRPYRCQPAPSADPLTVQPVFTSLRYGDAGYGQLSRRTPRAIMQGAEDGSEMGAFRKLNQPQRETNLHVRLDEYLRFGLEAGVVFVT